MPVARTAIRNRWNGAGCLGGQRISDGSWREYTHYIVLQGVNNPDSIRRHEDMSYDKLKSLLSDCIVHVNVNLRDERKRGVGRVYVGDMDVNLEMVLTGMGRYDGSVFTGWESFKSAEDSAKHQKLGIWADLDE